MLIPAFGVRYADFQHLRELGCVLVDTTCGSVLNVWKRVEQYARDGFTAVVHGKHFHEETKATTSQVTKYDGGRYIIVRDMDETELLCRFIKNEATAAEMQDKRMGVANQTTMLAGESLAIAGRIAAALTERFGPEHLEAHFRTFDTICSATQERQDAILELIEEPLDAMIVIGGYNSSNTNHLAKICSKKVPTYHISDSKCILPESGAILYKPVERTEEIQRKDWLAAGVGRIGITAGASTPNNKIGEAIERVLQSRGLAVPA